jgi:hypothetical protein
MRCVVVALLMLLSFGLFLFGITLYSNTWNGGYVWDDRAAIVQNPDVHSSFTPITNSKQQLPVQQLSDDDLLVEENNNNNNQNILQSPSSFDLFFHDFWGQDITLEFSHKSYRPLTTLSYRLNFLLSGISPHGFHIGNILIYGLCCVLYHQMISRWVDSETSLVASLLFTCHPVHVEAVASLVGRADSLCGLFYFLAILCYSDALPLTIPSSSTSTYQRIKGFLLTALAYLFAMFASFTKEIGMTVFGIFVLLEFFFHYLHQRVAFQFPDKHHLFLSKDWFMQWNLLIAQSTVTMTTAPAPTGSGEQRRRRSSSSSLPFQSTLLHYTKAVISFLSTALHTPLSFLSLRLLLSLLSISSILYLRHLLHGNYQLYSWTIMENHISLLPSFLSRALSYGHTHFLYSMKLFNPVTPRLCFDYGFPCLPTITSLSSPLNLFTLLVYLVTILIVLYSLLSFRLTLLLSFILILFPLLPALNILFPVGTLLAERLLFIPSAGATLLIAELYTHEFRSLWTSKSSSILFPSSSSSISISLPSPPLVGESQAHESDELPRTRFTISSLLPYCLLLLPLSPLLGVMAYRVRLRNVDWKTELSIYESSLTMCPDNVRALNNVAMIKSSVGLSNESAIHLERYGLSILPLSLPSSWCPGHWIYILFKFPLSSTQA